MFLEDFLTVTTHGTTVNKSRIEPKRYYRLRVGYVFKSGGSSRLFILQGPEEHEEADTDQAPAEQVTPKNVSEVGRVMTEEENEEWKKEREGGKEHEQDGGIDWGMGEDAVEEPASPADFGDVDKNPEEHHFKDPKKMLRGFFEREGLELEYDVEEKDPGHARVYHCKVKK
ncbi:Kanadaptin [Porites harrisoni]